MPIRMSAYIAVALLLIFTPFVKADITAVTGATLIDGTGAAPLKNAVVLIEAGRITAVGTTDSVVVPADAHIIKAKGKYIIPGLMDANLHLFLELGTENMVKYEGQYDDVIVEAAQVALKYGLTTVFDTWGPRAALNKAQKRINSGDEQGARIYYAGNIIGYTGPYGSDFRETTAAHLSPQFVERINEQWEEGTGAELLWMTPDQVRERVRSYTARGMDFIKYGASGHVQMGLITFSPRVQKVIVDEARRAGMTVQAHTTSTESLHLAVEAGIDIATHCDISNNFPISNETIQLMVTEKVACSVLPITNQRLKVMKEHVPAISIVSYMEMADVNLRNMIKAGVRLLMSTDAGLYNNSTYKWNGTANKIPNPRTIIGEGHFNALKGLVEKGMAPMEVLRSASSYVAEAYKIDEDVGTLEVGKRADLLIMDENPLTDPDNYRLINTVIQAGVVINRDALPMKPNFMVPYDNQALVQ